ncbi:MAG: enoyl-CoA hydratase/isomerase family protein [Chloroflexi bacterium]|nr:enoyl-CoA hydratase/isomerase family protein [Chloroflexota bacterium]
MSELVKSQRMGEIFEITLNRPGARNAINEAMQNELSQAFDQAEREFHQGARVVLLRGAGRVFSAGIDLQQFLTFDEGLRDNLFPITARYQALANQVERSSLPVICVLQGYCLGLALELALACDFRIAAERSKLGLPETRLGIIPDVGGTTRLVKLIGVAKAKDLVLTGRHIEAGDALEWGLLNAVYPKAELEQGVAKLVKSLVASAPLAVSYAKRVINDIVDNPRGLHIEAWAQAQLFRTSDFQRAIEAMLSKQYPIDWEGK